MSWSFGHLEIGLDVGSLRIKELRRLIETADRPTEPHFVICLSHAGPASLAKLSLEANHLLDSRKHPNAMGNRAIVVPINVLLVPGQILGWNVYTNFNVAQINAFLFINKKINPLGYKKGLKAGKYWEANKTLNPYHLD